jgi:hypothetical protein
MSDESPKTINLQSIARRHNSLSVITGLVYAIFAVLLWIGSFYVMKFLIGFVCMLWMGWPSRVVTDGGAVAGLLILAFEGFRRQKKLLDLEEYTGSFL